MGERIMRRSLIGFAVTALAVTGALAPMNPPAGLAENALSCLMNLPVINPDSDQSCPAQADAYVGLNV
jgi:hypothetical protein